MNTTLTQSIRKLRLSGMLQTLEVRLHEAQANQLSHEQFLELIVTDEFNIRQQRLIQRRLKAAQFRDLRTIEDFDFRFNPAISRSEIFELATAKFINSSEDILFVGPPGVGKTHLATAIGYQAIKAGFTVYYRSVFDLVRDLMEDEALLGQDKILRRYLKADLLIIDDMGIKRLPNKSGEYLFEIVMRRYEIRSTIMTSNRPIEEWAKLIGDVPSATAILDRFLHHAHIINITGKSYRMKNRACKKSNK